MSIHFDFVRRIALGVMAPALIVSATAGAQASNIDPRWEAWAGCWEPAPDASESIETAQRRVVCVTPISGRSAIEIAAITDGKVTARDTVDASGERRTSSTPGCTGWQRANWSRDARRVYLRSELTCGETLTRVSTGMLSISPSGEWLDVQGISANGNSAVRRTTYREVGPWFAELPAEFAEPLLKRSQYPFAARSLAGSALGTADIVDAVTQVDTLVVQAWLAARGNGYDLDAATLVELDEAGVPGSVTDVMIALSFPRQFAITDGSSTAAGAPAAMPIAGSAAGSRCESVDTRYEQDPCRRGFRSPGGYGWGYGDYGYGYGIPYDYGYGYGNGYGLGYGYGYDPRFGGGGFGGGTVVIIKEPDLPHGRAVNGRGYTRGMGPQSTSSDQAPPSGRASSSEDRQSGGSGSSSRATGRSSGSSGSSSGSSGGSTGRTAQRRPPPPPK